MSQYVLDFQASTARPHYSDFEVSLPRSVQKLSYRVELTRGQDGWVIAKCHAIKGAISQGKTVEEALRNVVEAMALVLEETFGKQAPEFLVLWDEK